MAEVFTILYSQQPGGTLITSSIILPEQTTAYSYSKPCEFNVYCQHAKVGVSDEAASAIRNQPCSAGYFTAPDAAWVGMETECYPYGYPSLHMSDMQVQSNSISDLGDYYQGWHSAISTIAWPGDQCMSGWTTACSTTITDIQDSSTYPQAWCCPGGDWTCATATAADDVYSPQRLCQSRLTDAQELYVNYFPPVTIDGVARALWTASIDNQAPNAAATAFHNAFPLQLTSPSNAQTLPTPTATGGEGGGSKESTESSLSSSSHSPTAAGNQNETHQQQDQATSGQKGPAALSQGAIAGLAVGATIAVVALLAGFFFLYKYRKRRLAARTASAARQSTRFIDNKPELDGHSAAAAVAVGVTSSKQDGGDDDDDDNHRNRTNSNWRVPPYYPNSPTGFVAELPADNSHRYELDNLNNDDNTRRRRRRSSRAAVAELRAEDVLPAEADANDFFPPVVGVGDVNDDEEALVSKNNGKGSSSKIQHQQLRLRGGGVGDRSATDSPTVPR